jgi:hypothetical protein
MNNMKRGQLTLFVIAAIVIVVAISLYFVFSGETTEVVGGGELTGSLDEKISVIREDLLDCFTGVYEDSLVDVGAGGGYYFEPLTMYLEDGENRVPFYYFSTLQYIPTEEFVLEEIGYAIESKDDGCFSALEGTGLEYDFVYSVPNISIEEDYVVFVPFMELEFTEENITKKFDLSSEKIRVSSHIGLMRDLAVYVASSYSLANESLCISCYLDAAIDLNLVVEIDDSLDQVLLVTVLDPQNLTYPGEWILALTAINEGVSELSDMVVTSTPSEHILVTSEIENYTGADDE